MPDQRTFPRIAAVPGVAGVMALLACFPSAACAQGTPEESAAPARTHVETGDGLRLAIYEHGRAGAPAVVFIHGFSQSAHTWEPQVAGLSHEFHVVTYDMRGHGASDRPLDAERYTESAFWADELAAVIRAANLHRPIVVGWSYGGYVISDYVRKYGQDALGGIVFLGAVTSNGTEQATAFLTDEVLSIFGDVLSPEPLAGIDGTAALVSMFATPGSARWTRAFGSAMTVPPSVRLAMFSRMLDNDDVLASLRVPTLVVHGTSDRIVRVAAAQHIAATVPAATLLLYQGAGHAPHLDEPERFNRDLATFVRAALQSRAAARR